MAYDHTSLTNNPHSVTAAQVGALALAGGTLTGKVLTASTGEDNYGGAFEIKELGNVGGSQSAWSYSPAITFHWNNTDAKRFGLRSDGNLAVDNSIIYHAGNSNRTSVNWSAAKLTSTTLLLPQTAPSLSSGEMAIYGLESGFSGELPSGAGSVTSIALTVPTGLRVKKDVGGAFAQTATITESGEFIVEITSGYTLPTSSQVADFTTAFTNRITSLTTTGSGAATLTSNVLNIPTYSLPTATASFLGGVKIGSNITITDGVISVTAPHNAVTLGTANGLSLSTQVLSLGLATTSTNGALSSTDWNTFNGKQAKLIGTGASSLVRVNASGVVVYDDSAYLTTASAASTYLPLSGGVLSGRFGALDIKRNDGALYSVIKFSNTTTTLGYLGFSPSSDPVFVMADGATIYPLYHSGNSNRTTVDWSAKNLTLAGSINYSGATDFSIQYGGTTNIRVNSYGNLILSSNAQFMYFRPNGNLIATNEMVLNTIGVLSVPSLSLAGSITGATTITASSTIQATTAKLTNLTDGYIPYHISDGSGLGNSVITQTSGNLNLGSGKVTLAENINTNLRIPKVAPTSPTSGEYYFYIVE